MATAKTACCFLVLLALLSAPLASSATDPPRHGRRPNRNDDVAGGFYGMPWFGGGGAEWGAGGAWYRRGAAVRPSTVCAEPGPCHGKRLTCPERCFRSYSYTSKNGDGGGGGGGGGCSFDCTKRCVAFC